MVSLADAIISLNSSALFSYSGNDADSIIWHNETTPISKEDILAEQQRLQAIDDA
tara:strand:+ start:544 stop:708 length:165 start_codon:yes stop_codon:yes gene_type:complete